MNDGTGRNTKAVLFRGVVIILISLIVLSFLFDGPMVLGEDQGGSNGGIYQQKELPPKIERLVFPSVVHPEVPVLFKVIVKCSTPENAVLWVDSDRPWINFTCSVLRSEFKVSDLGRDWASLDPTNSTVTLNSTTKNYDIVFSVALSWMFEGNKAYPMACEVSDPFGLKDRFSISESYVFEKDLVIDGEATLLRQDGSQIAFDDYLQGGALIVVEGISVHFEGSPNLSPSPERISIGLKDQTGRIWEYRPRMVAQVNKISFSFPLPRSDGLVRFDFEVFSSPMGTDTHGSVGFNVLIDSTSPILGDPRYSYSDGSVHFNWAYTEIGSGIKVSSVRYSIEDRAGMVIVGLRTPLGASLVNERLAISFEAPPGYDLSVNLALSDMVDNPLQGDVSFIFTTRTKPVHDLSIDTGLVMNPEVVIEGQLLSIRTRVENLGSVDERAVTAEVRMDGEHYSTIDVGTVPAGSARDNWWTLTVSGQKTRIEIEVDPQSTVHDEDRSNNVMSFELWPDYLDVYADPGYFGISNREAKPYEIVDITFKVNCLGTLRSGGFKVLFLQDERFLGIFEMEPMEPDQSSYLITSWKVDPEARNLTIIVDPYNEVLETVEGNNRLDRKNPFFKEPSPEVHENPSVPIDDESKVPVEEGPEEPGGDGPAGGTTWEGPVDGPTEGHGGQVIVGPGPVYPDVAPGPMLPPFILPSVAVTLGLSVLGSALLISKFEPARYKIALALVPLYSKLKKNKVEVGTRYEILGYLKAKPGANYSELKEILDLNDGSLVHHLRILEREDKIYSKKMGKFKLFYVSSYRRQSAVQSYVSPLHKRILEIISQNPGIVPKKLSVILDRSQTDISYHLGELARNGFLDRKKKGRNIHYYINKDLSGMM